MSGSGDFYSFGEKSYLRDFFFFFAAFFFAFFRAAM